MGLINMLARRFNQWTPDEYEVEKVRDGRALFMDMGTGKSLVAIALLENYEFKRTLILAPKSVITTDVWPKEFAKHATTDYDICVLRDKDSLNQRARLLSEFLANTTRPAVVIINWEALSSAHSSTLRQALLEARFDYWIADEIQRLKTPSSKISVFCRQLARRIPYRVGLTGTPTTESPFDIYGIYRVLDTSVFGTNMQRFKNRYAVMGGYGGHQVLYYKNLNDLSARMYRIAYRVDKSILNLPEPWPDIERDFELSGPLLKVYKELNKHLITQIKSGEVSVNNILTKLLRLQQITSGFLPLDEEGKIADLHTDRINLLSEVVGGLPTHEPLVIFARFTRDIEYIKRAVSQLGRTPLERSGSRDEVAAWQDGQGDTLVLQIAAGSAGIDLTRAKYAIYYSLSFSGAEHEQSRARLHRPGQTDRVTYIYLAAKDTVDEYILEAIRNKDEVSRYVLDKLRNKK